MHRANAGSVLAVSVLCAATLSCAGWPVEKREPLREPLNVILLIGDGMGPSQITLARIVAGMPLALDSIGVTGLVWNGSASGPVTDSAAAATALACGAKTKNKMLGVDPFGRTLPSIAEELAAAGYRIGIVTTTRVTHATPAAFYAHVRDRDREDEIARQFATSDVTVCLGGGARFFPADARRKLEERGFTIVTGGRELTEAIAKGRARLLGLLGPDHCRLKIDHGAESLSTLSSQAIDLLSLGDGSTERPPYFLMIEGGRIDQACHGHDAPAAFHEMIDFDAAVKAALWAARRNGRTLLIVTADHATCGLAISERVNVDGLRRVRSSSSAMLARAHGDPERLREIVREMAEVELSPLEAQEAVRDRFKYAKAGFLAHTISARLGVHFAYPLDEQETHDSTEGHDATLVPLYAEGPHAERFQGTLDNTEIAKRIREVTLGRMEKTARAPFREGSATRSR